MTNVNTIIHLLRDSVRPVSHGKLMDDAAIMLQQYDTRIRHAIAELNSQIDGGEECRGRDSEISHVIHILEGKSS